MLKLTPIVAELIAVREARGISQAVVADRIGVDQAVISNWERGKRQPKGPALKLLEAFLTTERERAA